MSDKVIQQKRRAHIETSAPFFKLFFCAIAQEAAA